MHRNIRNDNSALLIGLSIGGSGGIGGEIPLPSGKWNVIVTVKRVRYSTMREQLIDRMIKIYGFEHEIVVAFYDVCKAFPKYRDWETDRKSVV